MASDIVVDAAAAAGAGGEAVADAAAVATMSAASGVDVAVTIADVAALDLHSLCHDQPYSCMLSVCLTSATKLPGARSSSSQSLMMCAAVRMRMISTEWFIDTLRS